VKEKTSLDVLRVRTNDINHSYKISSFLSIEITCGIQIKYFIISSSYLFFIYNKVAYCFVL